MGMMEQQLVIKKRPTIGVFFGYTSAYTESIWTGIVEKAKEEKVNTVAFLGEGLAHKLHNHTIGDLVYQLANEHSIDGLIILTSAIRDTVSQQVLTEFCHQYLSLPIVSIGDTIEGVSNLTVDSMTGLRDLTLHLIDQHGLRRIAFLKGLENNSEAKERYHAYQQALSDRNILIDESLIVQGAFTYKQGFNAVENLITRDVEFDAIATSNDESAMGVIDALKKKVSTFPRM